MSSTEQWLANASKPAADRHPEIKFPTVGMAIIGRIANEPRTVESEEDDGRKVEKLVIDLEVMNGTTAVLGTLRSGFTPVTPGDIVTVWAKAGLQGRALAEAILTAGAKGLGEGGILALAYVGDGPKPTDPKKSAAKLWKAEYQAPAPVVGIGASMLGGQAAPESF
jgi:hypothetical protein